MKNITKILSMIGLGIVITGCVSTKTLNTNKNCNNGMNPETKKCFYDDRESETYYWGYPLTEG